MSNFIKSILVACSVLCSISCHNKQQDETYFTMSDSEEQLQTFANIHNAGLDYIKKDVIQVAEEYTPERLDSVFSSWATTQYGREGADSLLKQIHSMKRLAFKGILPSPVKTRSRQDVYVQHAIPLAQEALDICMKKISHHLNLFTESELFDNKPLLLDLQKIIKETHLSYTQKCASEVDKKALDETLGVLYGSIEYWTSSTNVNAWSKKDIESSQDSPQIGARKRAKKTKTDREDDRVLSKHEWVMTVAAADAGGAAVGTPALGLACSAAVGLYFDVR